MTGLGLSDGREIERGMGMGGGGNVSAWVRGDREREREILGAKTMSDLSQ